jgi:Uri superfamily endonuclease
MLIKIGFRIHNGYYSYCGSLMAEGRKVESRVDL